MDETFKSLSCVLAFVALPLLARADVLIATNGERFVGTVIEETTNTVVFESGLGWRLTLSPAQIRKLERTAPPPTDHDLCSLITNGVSAVSIAVTNAPANVASWKPARRRP